MTIFKTILWTTLFWLLVFFWLWVSSLFFPNEATIIIPQKVKNVIIEWAEIQNCAQEPQEQVKIEEPTTEEIEANTPTVEEEVTPVEEPEVAPVEEPVVEEPAIEQTTNSILPQPSNTTSTNDEIIALQNRVAEVEAKYDGLVNELQTIFATPVFAQLLSQAFAENQVTAEAN
jgi:hypothetical protein